MVVIGVLVGAEAEPVAVSVIAVIVFVLVVVGLVAATVAVCDYASFDLHFKVFVFPLCHAFFGAYHINMVICSDVVCDALLFKRS
jgi:hypothetical protein